MDAYRLSYKQEQALNAILDGKNVFLSDNAGTGKTAVIKEFIRTAKRNAVVLAPTGAAALLIGGSTVHSFFGLPIGVYTQDNLPNPSEKQREIIKTTEIIVIDEVSMLRVDQLEAIDLLLCRLAPPSRKSLPFGGKQMILVGDFLQLPAFAREQEVKDYLNYQYNGLQAFKAPCWKQTRFENFYLDTTFRQDDNEYLDIINAVRINETDYCEETVVYERFIGEDFSIEEKASYLDTLNDRCWQYNQEIDYDTICLCCTNHAADTINRTANSRIPEMSTYFFGHKYGKFPNDNLPVANRLDLKIGTKVMLRANKPSPQGGFEYVNGNIGTVLDMYPGERPFVDVRLLDGRVVTVTEAYWSNYEYQLRNTPDGGYRIAQVEAGRYYQLPISPAWAISIHKSQGLSLPKAHLVLGDKACFCSGQLYVALSRVPSLRCLTLDRPVTEADIIVDQEAVKFYDELRESELIVADSY
jgi:hypothetical protein